MRRGRVVSLLLAAALAALTFSCGGSDAGATFGTYDPPDLGLTVVTRQVQVELPVGRQPVAGLRVMNSLGPVELGAGGQAELPAFDGGPQLTAVVTAADNAMLLGWIDDQQQVLSARTTAEVLFYRQLGGWLVPQSLQPRLVELIREEIDLASVEAAIAAALAADPDALADGEPAVSAALAQVTQSLLDAAEARSLLIDPSESKSGLEVLHTTGVHRFQVKNWYRRRAHAWLMRVEYVPAGGTLPVAAYEEIEDFSIPAVVGSRDVLATVMDLITGVIPWEPVELPARTLELYPDDAKYTRYELMTVGPGYGEGEMDRLTDAQRDKRTQLVRYQFVVDFVVPLVANVMLPIGGEKIDDYLGWINGSGVVQDLVNILGSEVPNLWSNVETGDTAQAIKDVTKAILTSNTLRLVAFQKIWDGIFEADGLVHANQFGAIADKVMAVMTAVNLGLTAIDSIIQTVHWAESNGADSWDLVVTSANVQLSPEESHLPTNREQRLTCTLPNNRADDAPTLAYHFACTGRVGMIYNDRHATPATSFDSSLAWVNYRPNGDAGDDDRVIVTVSQIIAGEKVPVGQAEATVHVSHVWLDPAELTVATNDRPSIGVSIQNDPGPYQIVWRTSNGRLQPDGATGWATRWEGNATVVHYGRGTGFEGEAQVTVEVSHDDGTERYPLGDAVCNLTLEAFRVPCELKGYATITPDVFVGASYGIEFDKVPEASGYTIIGSGFHDPLFYQDAYRNSLPPLRGSDQDLGGRLYDAMTSGGGSYDPNATEASLIAEHAWRFTGGEFWAYPHWFSGPAM